MADPKKRLPTNVAGEFFVDSTCIDCDACRQVAPGVFAEMGEYSSVYQQPHTKEQERDAWRALLTCPVGSIGCSSKGMAAEVQKDFPLHVAEDVYFCGFNSRDSFGANSYFITHPDGNWLVEAPRYVKGLAQRLEEMGGVAYIFLSHRDDVADAAKYASQFGSKRIIHKGDLSAQPDAEIVVEGRESQSFGKDFLLIPTPGHSRGHCVLLYKNKFLFTGDHLHWDRDDKRLDAYKTYCWYSWDEQKKSMESLLSYEFEWVLPGHGQSVNLPSAQMQESLAQVRHL